MICHNLSEILGFVCHPLSEDGELVMIESPLTFPNGNTIPIFLKKIGNNIQFFDDHETVYHYIKSGYRGTEKSLDTSFIRSAIEPYELEFTDNQISIWGRLETAKLTFAKYLSGLMAASNLANPSSAGDSRIKALVAEVADLLQVWRSSEQMVFLPEYKGISKTTYKLDFSIGNEAIIVATPHPNSVGSALKKMVDIAGSGNTTQFRVILEDRSIEKSNFDSQSIILSTMATVMPFTLLKKEATSSKARAH